MPNIGYGKRASHGNRPAARADVRAGLRFVFVDEPAR
jgi:hypothetical protein